MIIDNDIQKFTKEKAVGYPYSPDQKPIHL
jgi:hypothetical protein